LANAHPEETFEGLAEYDDMAAVTIRGEDVSMKMDGLPRTLH
jgi:hypothetical protein